MKALTIEDLRKSAKELAVTKSKEMLEEEKLIQQFINEIDNADASDEAFNSLFTLLNLPDDKFITLSPYFLEEFEKSYNNTDGQILLLQTMNLKGIKSEQVRDEYLALSEQLDKELPQLSIYKRDFLRQMFGIIYNAVANAEGIAKRIIIIPVEKTSDSVKLPTYAHVSDAGLDIYALDDITIAPGETKLIPTGIKVAIPFGYELQIRPKSGRCLKTKLRVANTPATIDSGYRQEIGIILENIDPPIRSIETGEATMDENGKIVNIPITNIIYGQSYTIGKDEKIAQLVLNEVPKVQWLEVDSISVYEGDRGGGYGSSGLK